MNHVNWKERNQKELWEWEEEKELEEILSKQKDNKTNKSCGVIHLGLY